jgi:L-ribulose-5-phosphate 3-epimerase
MIVGVHAAMVERRHPLPESIRRAAEFGADAYEIDIGIAFDGTPWGERAGRYRAQARGIRDLAAAVGIRLPSVCLGVLWQSSLASADAAEVAQGQQIVRDGLAFAASIGADAVLLPVGQPLGLTPERAREHLIAALADLVPVADDEGVTLALENVAQRVLADAADLLQVVQAVGSPRCGVYYDLGNPTFIGGDPVSELRALAGQVARLHVKDTIAVARPHMPLPDVPVTGDFTVWRNRTTVTIGSGELPYPTLAALVHEIGYRGPLIIEVPQPAEQVEAGCRANLAATRWLFGA